MFEIRPCTVAELEGAPNIDALLAEYARESGTPEIGDPQPQFEAYRALQASGHFHPIGAFDGASLLGFILPVVVKLPHYGVLAATIESFFVTPGARSQGVGLKLLCCSEELGRALGAKALLLSAPAAGALSRVMGLHREYRKSHEVYVRALA